MALKMALDSPTLKSFTHGNWQFPTRKNAEKCLDQAKIRVRDGKNILVRRSMLLGTPHEPLIQKLGMAWIVFHRLLLNGFVINNKINHSNVNPGLINHGLLIRGVLLQSS